MPNSPTKEPGLRERKKLRTREAIRTVALEHFLAKGYDATTTEQIARAADVSVGTLFNYFPTKESLLADDFDPVFISHLRARPASEPLFTAVRRAMEDSMSTARDQSALSFARAKLMSSAPALRAAAARERQQAGELLTALMAERCQRSPDDFELRVASAMIVSAMVVAQQAWLERDGKGDILELVDRALAVAEAGASLQLRTSRPRASK